jgi:hypothetical protein
MLKWIHRIPVLLALVAGPLLLAIPVKAQDFAEVDGKTYRLYLEKDWKELIRAGRSALKEDIDYYYLRVRMGIAFYERRNYKSAQLHFKKALDFSEGDPVASEYLYYACLLGGQTHQAALLHDGFRPALKEKIPGPGLKMVDRVSAEYLYSHMFTDGIIEDAGSFESLPAGVQIITRSYQNLNVALSHTMHPGVSFTHAYTYLGKTNYYYYNDGLSRFGVDGQSVRQHQYYLSPSFTTRGGLVISPSFHFLHVGFEVPYLSAGGPGPGGNGITWKDDFANQLAGGLSLAKYLGPFTVRIGAVYSNLNEARQSTATAGLTWYPLGNLDLYVGTNIHAHMADLDVNRVVPVYDLLLGYGIASKVWLEVSAAYGEMKNYTETNGYIVYNGLDWMKFKSLATLVIPVTEKGSVLYAGVRHARYENRIIAFDRSLYEYAINKLYYNSISIYGGLSWKF